jgi:antitoxin MazE
MKMQIGKWGNSLAVRLPKEVVDCLNLKEGNSIGSRVFERALRDIPMTREQALDGIKALRRPPPDEWKFDRDEAKCAVTASFAVDTKHCDLRAFEGAKV